jgi:hypothetical protein
MSLLNFSENAAGQIYSASNIGLIIGAILVALATFGSIWSGGVLARGADRKLSENIAETAKANEGQAIANAEAAKANERATQLELASAKFQKEAAEARLELARLQEKMAWRIVTPEQEQSFITYLHTAPKAKVSMTYLSNDPETANFAVRIAELLNNAGYDAPKGLREMSSVLPIGLMVGVTISVKDEKNVAAGALQSAFRTISIDAQGSVRPEQRDDIAIEVGQKLR